MSIKPFFVALIFASIVQYLVMRQHVTRLNQNGDIVNARLNEHGESIASIQKIEEYVLELEVSVANLQNQLDLISQKTSYSEETAHRIEEKQISIQEDWFVLKDNLETQSVEMENMLRKYIDTVLNDLK